MLEIEETSKLIVPVKSPESTIRFYVHTEEIFDILWTVHSNNGHGRRDIMEKDLNLKYKNITRPVIADFLEFCESCKGKKSKIKKGIVEQRKKILEPYRAGRYKEYEGDGYFRLKLYFYEGEYYG